MLRVENDNLLDLIYEAAYEPACWTNVIERLGDVLGGNLVWLSQLNARDGSGGTVDDPMARVDPIWPQRYLEYYGALNPLAFVDDPDRYLREWRPIVLTDEEWLAKEDLVRTEYYNDFLRPQDGHSVMWIRLVREGSHIAVLNVSRSERGGRFNQPDFKVARTLQPHLIRAFKMGKRLGLGKRREQEAEMMLDLSASALFLLDTDGTLRHANCAGERMLASGTALTVAGGKLRTKYPARAKDLERLIANAASPDAAVRTGGSMALYAPRRTKPFSILVTPMGPDRFTSVATALSVCVSVTDLEAEIYLPEHALREVFALTAAEMRLAQALYSGASLKEAAGRFDISTNTVRVQLASIFRKTQTNRQPDLVAVLARLAQQWQR
jgi:DNA-binding CsgD family transcriptional regulator